MPCRALPFEIWLEIYKYIRDPESMVALSYLNHDFWLLWLRVKIKLMSRWAFSGTRSTLEMWDATFGLAIKQMEDRYEFAAERLKDLPMTDHAAARRAERERRFGESYGNGGLCPSVIPLFAGVIALMFTNHLLMVNYSRITHCLLLIDEGITAGSDLDFETCEDDPNLYFDLGVDSGNLEWEWSLMRASSRSTRHKEFGVELEEEAERDEPRECHCENPMWNESINWSDWPERARWSGRSAVLNDPLLGARPSFSHVRSIAICLRRLELRRPVPWQL